VPAPPGKDKGNQGKGKEKGAVRWGTPRKELKEEVKERD
jgi:hypothetical protein